MKRLLVFIAVALVCSWSTAQDQDPLYLVFEFMKVDNEQEAAYAATEDFWEKVHEQRVKNGDCIGWDLWSLQPGGEDQNFQYMTVSLYNDPVKMMTDSGYMDAWNAAYPNLSDEESAAKMEQTAKSRDLIVRVYLQEIDQTNATDFDMPLGTLAVLNFMKAKPGMSGKYEKMESEVFKPMHQQQIDAGGRGSWGLLRNMLGYASDIYATHIAVDMYTDYDQFFNGASGWDGTPMTEEQQKTVQDGLATRDLRMVKHATLIKKVRAEPAQ